MPYGSLHAQESKLWLAARRTALRMNYSIEKNAPSVAMQSTIVCNTFLNGATLLFVHLEKSSSSFVSICNPLIFSIINHPCSFMVYCLIIIWQSKSERSDWFFPGRDFAIRTVSVETVISCAFFVFDSQQIQNKHGPNAI